MATTISPYPLRPFVGPGRVLAGPGSAAKLGSELGAIGAPEGGRVLVVADQALIRLGLVDAPVRSLVESGFDVVVGPGVEAEPGPATVDGLVAALAGESAVAVIGVGGGSAIDASKLVAAALTNELALTAGLTPDAALDPVPLLAAVPTTAGTGAETTAVAMLWHKRRKLIFVHERLVPRHATLDPDLLEGLPRPVVAASGLDAISHAVESLLSNFRTPLTARAAESALVRLARAVPVEYRATDPQAREAMSLGAFESGLALNASVVVGHSIAYTIAARTGLSHGLTCAMALPYCLAYNRSASEGSIARMSELTGVASGAEGFVTWLAELTRSLDIPDSLEAVGIAASDIGAMARECCERYPRANNPVPLTVDAVECLLGHFHSGAIDAAWAQRSVIAA